MASASDAPDSTSVRVGDDDGGEVLVLFLPAENVEALHERQAGVDHHGELAREHGQVLADDTLADLAAGIALLFLGGLGFRRFAGVMRVTRICSRRSAATAASIVSAMRSPLTVWPARVRPE